MDDLINIFNKNSIKKSESNSQESLSLDQDDDTSYKMSEISD